jgi:type IV pilus assembly protein PilO
MAAIAESLREFQESLQSIDLNDLDFENIGAWPIAVKVIAWALVFSLVIFGGYKFIISDIQAGFDVIASKEAQLKKEFETKAFEAANLEAYRKQMVEMEESFGALVGQLPSDTEVPGLLEDISNKGVSNGLDFRSIALKPEHAAEFYVELPIDILVQGTFHDMGAFVSGVAGLPRIVTLHDFTIAPDKDNASRLLMTIVAKTYRYKDDRSDSADQKKGLGGKTLPPAQNKGLGGKKPIAPSNTAKGK